jgi:flagella basal body P-ring formation protein FlgA
MSVLLAILMWMNVAPTTVQPELIRKAVENYVATRWDASQGDYILEVRSLPSHLSVNSTEYSIQVGIGSAPRLKGHVGIPIEIIVAGKTVQKAVVPVLVRTFGNVVSTGRQMQRHEALSAEDILVQRLETTSLGDDILTSGREIEGRRTARIIAANSVLSRSVVESIPAIRLEDAITVIVRSGKATLTTQGVAKQEGGIGDVITVQRPGSHDRFRAVIVDAKSVLVDAGQDLFSRLEKRN